MNIKVKYFASLAEQLGCREQDLELGSGATVEDLWRSANGGGIPDNVLQAVNHEYVDSGTCLCDGDEVAFFPPVTGG